MNNTRKEHYVSQMYLRYFSEAEKCYVSFNNKEVRCSLIKNICYANDIYEVTNVLGHQVLANLVENAHSRVESVFGSMISDFITELDNVDNSTFDEMIMHNRDVLIKFITFLFLRNRYVLSASEEVFIELYHRTRNQAHNSAILVTIETLMDIATSFVERFSLTIYRNNTNINFITSNIPALIAGWGEFYYGYFTLAPNYFILLQEKSIFGKKDVFIETNDIKIVDRFNRLRFLPNVKNKILISKDKESLVRYCNSGGSKYE